MVDVDNYAMWSFTNKAAIGRYKKAGCWRDGSVFGSILARINVRGLDKEHNAILMHEIHCKREPSDEDEDAENEDFFGVSEDDDSPPAAAAAAKPPDKLGYLGSAPTAKFNDRVKKAQAMRRVSGAQKRGANLSDIADALSPARKRLREAAASDPSTGVPDSVTQWYGEFDNHGRNGLVGLVPRPLEKHYASSKFHHVSLKKLLKSPEGQAVVHYAKWRDKNDQKGSK